MTTPPDLGDLLDGVSAGILPSESEVARETVRAAVVANARRLTAAWAYMSLMARTVGDDDTANAESSRALALWHAARETGDPGPPTPSEIESIVLLLLADTDAMSETIALARAAVEQAADDPRPFAALGFALLEAGEHAEAEQTMIESATRWLRMNAVDRALVDASIAAGLPEASPKGVLLQVRALAAKGEAAAARARYDELIAAEPDARSAVVEAELDLLERRPEDALAKADTLLAERPRDADALGVRALALRDQGRILDAIDVLGQGVESGGGDRLRFIRASLLTMTGQQDAALAELATLGPFSTALPVVKLMRAEVLSQRGDYAQSVDWFDRFLQADPGNPIGIGERLIACFSRDGVYEDVAGEMDALVAEPPTDPMVAAWLERQNPAQYPLVRGHLLVLPRAATYPGGEVRRRGSRSSPGGGHASTALGPALVTVPLARALVSSDQPDEALAVIDSAPPAVAATTAVQIWKAQALVRKNLLGEALEAVTEALVAMPNDPPYVGGATRFSFRSDGSRRPEEPP